MNDSYLLADDLSGALEVGASFRARGHRVRVPLAAGTNDPAALEVVTTETRNASPANAAQAVHSALQRQQTAGRRLIFKKIDSTLRGPFAAEVTALVETLQPSLVVICPSNPATGRAVVDGILRVNGTPLTETDFRRDPIWPATTSRIADLWPANANIAQLALANLRSPDATQRLEEIRRQGARIVVSDAETAGDLDRLLSVTRRVCADTVFVGANGLGDALARADQPAASSATSNLPTLSSLLAICGSRHPASHRQIEQLAAAHHVPLLTLTPGTAKPEKLFRELSSQLESHRLAALRFDPTHPADPADLMRETAALLAPFARATLPAAYFFTGGETAWSACAALGGESLEVVGTSERAIVVSQLQRRGASPAFILTKPGGYGDDAVLVRAIAELMK